MQIKKERKKKLSFNPREKMIISNNLGTSKNVYYSKFLKKNKGNSKSLIYFLT